MTDTSTDRDYQLRIARGDLAEPHHLDAVRIMHLTREHWAEADPELAAALAEGDARNPDRVPPPGPKPWEPDTPADPATVEAWNRRGELVLDEVSLFLGRFVAFPSPAAQTAVTLWVAHCWMIREFESTPRLALLSPEPGSGKTRVLEVVELLVPAPQHALNASVAAVFRMIRDDRPTLLLDEVDAVFRSKGKEDSNEELRGILNSGHSIGATVPRCAPPTHEVQHFPVFCAVAMAGLGDLPDTLMSRSVVIRMRRRAPNEKVDKLRRRLIRPEARELRQRLAAWADSVAESCGKAFPVMPEGITDRAEDVWEPLIAVADAAGGSWPKFAREACLELNKVRQDAQTLGTKLLDDIRTVFDGRDRLSTADLVSKLMDQDGSPWAEWLESRSDRSRGSWLARKLKPYEIVPRVHKIGGAAVRGYLAEDFADAWARYLRPLNPQNDVTANTNVTGQVTPTSDVTSPTTVTSLRGETDPHAA